MLARSHTCFERRLPLVAMLTALAVAQPAAQAQYVNGSIAVSATILPPAPKQATRLIAFSVERSGIARLESTAPIPGAVSQIVMWTVSSSANGFVPVEQPPLRIYANPRPEAPELPASARASRAARLRYEVDLGGASSSPSESSPRDVTVRINYLIVPGT